MFGITQLYVIRGICLLEGRWEEGGWGNGGGLGSLIYNSSSSEPLRAHRTHLALCQSAFFFNTNPPFLPPPPRLRLGPDVPVPLLQVHQHRPEPTQNARDDAALCPAHATMPAVPGHAQQQDPPAVPPHAPPQRGPRLRGQAHRYCECARRSRPLSSPQGLETLLGCSSCTLEEATRATRRQAK